MKLTILSAFLFAIPLGAAATEIPVSAPPLFRVMLEIGKGFKEHFDRTSPDDGSFFTFDGNLATYVNPRGETKSVSCPGPVTEPSGPSVDARRAFWDADRETFVHMSYKGDPTLWAMDFKNGICRAITKPGDVFEWRFSFQAGSRFVYAWNDIGGAFHVTSVNPATGEVAELFRCSNHDASAICSRFDAQDLATARTVGTLPGARAILRSNHAVYLFGMIGNEPAIATLLSVPSAKGRIDDAVYYAATNELYVASKNVDSLGWKEGTAPAFAVTKIDMANFAVSAVWRSNETLGVELNRIAPFLLAWGSYDASSQPHAMFAAVKRIDLKTLAEARFPTARAIPYYLGGLTINWYDWFLWDPTFLVHDEVSAHDGEGLPNSLVADRIGANGVAAHVAVDYGEDLGVIPAEDRMIALDGRELDGRPTTRIYSRPLFDVHAPMTLLATLPGYHSFYSNSLGYWHRAKVVVYYDAAKKALVRLGL